MDLNAQHGGAKGCRSGFFIVWSNKFVVQRMRGRSEASIQAKPQLLKKCFQTAVWRSRCSTQREYKREGRSGEEEDEGLTTRRPQKRKNHWSWSVCRQFKSKRHKGEEVDHSPWILSGSVLQVKTRNLPLSLFLSWNESLELRMEPKLKRLMPNGRVRRLFLLFRISSPGQ